MWKNLYFIDLSKIEGMDAVKLFAVIGALKCITDEYDNTTFTYDKHGRLVIASDADTWNGEWSGIVDDINDAFSKINLDLRIEL